LETFGNAQNKMGKRKNMGVQIQMCGSSIFHEINDFFRTAYADLDF